MRAGRRPSVPKKFVNASECAGGLLVFGLPGTHYDESSKALQRGEQDAHRIAQITGRMVVQ